METVTRDMQISLRRYHLERKIFFQLMELKRLQIRHGKANEHVLVKRQVKLLSRGHYYGDDDYIAMRITRITRIAMRCEAKKSGGLRFSIFFRWKPFIDRACPDPSLVLRDTIDS